MGVDSPKFQGQVPDGERVDRRVYTSLLPFPDGGTATIFGKRYEIVNREAEGGPITLINRGWGRESGDLPTRLGLLVRSFPAMRALFQQEEKEGLPGIPPTTTLTVAPSGSINGFMEHSLSGLSPAPAGVRFVQTDIGGPTIPDPQLIGYYARGEIPLSSNPELYFIDLLQSLPGAASISVPDLEAYRLLNEMTADMTDPVAASWVYRLVDAFRFHASSAPLSIRIGDTRRVMSLSQHCIEQLGLKNTPPTTSEKGPEVKPKTSSPKYTDIPPALLRRAKEIIAEKGMSDREVKDYSEAVSERLGVPPERR